MAITESVDVIINDQKMKPEYISYVNKMFINSPVLHRAAEIYQQKEGKLNFEEYRNILLNVYLIAINESSEGLK